MVRRGAISSTERVLGFVLTSALRPGWDPATLAERVIGLGVERWAVEMALAKVRRSLVERPGPVGERAEQALVLALALSDERDAAVPAAG